MIRFETLYNDSPFIPTPGPPAALFLFDLGEITAPGETTAPGKITAPGRAFCVMIPAGGDPSQALSLLADAGFETWNGGKPDVFLYALSLEAQADRSCD